MNVLFVSAGRRVELLRSFRRALDEIDPAGRIVAVDIDPIAPALQVADTSYIVPRLSDDRFVGCIVDVCERERIDLVFPLIDPDVPVLARHRAQIEATGARVVAVSEDAALTVGDKLLTDGFFRNLGVSTPRCWVPEEIDPHHFRYPAFIKPRNGSASENAFPVRNARELEFFSTYIARPIVQEYVDGPEITSDVLCDFDGSVRAVVSRRRIQVRAGEVTKGVTVYDPEIADQCVLIAKSLGAIGPITVQCLLKDGQPTFTEVNPRFGGGLPLGIAAGVDSPKWLLAWAAGRDVDVPPIGSYEVGVCISRYDESLLLREEQIADAQSRRL
jgi:carbamoyl-phosphate synthase large subunit